MDILRDLFDGFSQWALEKSDKQFAAGVGCGCLLAVLALAMAAVLGFWIGAKW